MKLNKFLWQENAHLMQMKRGVPMAEKSQTTLYPLLFHHLADSLHAAVKGYAHALAFPAFLSVC